MPSSIITSWVTNEKMAFDDPVAWFLVAVNIVVPVIVIYGIYRLIKFAKKVNRFIDDQEQEKKKKELLH